MTRISWIFHLSSSGDEEKWCGVVVVVFLGAGTKVKQSKHCFCILELTKINKKINNTFFPISCKKSGFCVHFLFYVRRKVDFRFITFCFTLFIPCGWNTHIVTIILCFFKYTEGVEWYI